MPRYVPRVPHVPRGEVHPNSNLNPYLNHYSKLVRAHLKIYDYDFFKSTCFLMKNDVFRYIFGMAPILVPKSSLGALRLIFKTLLSLMKEKS